MSGLLVNIRESLIKFVSSEGNEPVAHTIVCMGPVRHDQGNRFPWFGKLAAMTLFALLTSYCQAGEDENGFFSANLHLEMEPVENTPTTNINGRTYQLVSEYQVTGTHITRMNGIQTVGGFNYISVTVPHPSIPASLTVPSTYKGLGVREIGPYGLCHMPSPDSGYSPRWDDSRRPGNAVLHVTIPDSIWKIHDEGLSQNPYLQSVSFDGWCRLGNGVLADNPSLTSVRGFPIQFRSHGPPFYFEEYIPHGSFVRTGLSAIPKFDGHVDTLECCFAQCANLTSAIVPDGVSTIADNCFWDCLRLSSVSLPSSLRHIGDYAFADCPELETLTIPNGVTNIGYQVVGRNGNEHQGCRSLKLLRLPRSFLDWRNGETGYWGNGGNGYENQKLSKYLGVPEGCSVVFGEPVALTVESIHSTESPRSGNWFSWIGARIPFQVESPVLDEENPSIRYVCTGWTGSGDIPASGSDSSFEVTITQPSSVRWNWETNVLVQFCLIEGTSTNAVSSWQPFGTPLHIPVSSESPSFTVVFSGDSEGVEVDATRRELVVPAERPRTFSATIVDGAVFGAMPLVCSTGGETEWFSIADETAVGGSAFRSGRIDSGGESVLEMSPSGSGTFSFDWKIEAGRADFVRFYVDGELVESLSRNPSWVSFEVDLPEGDHVVRWVFERHTANVADVDAAFVANIVWNPPLALRVVSSGGNSQPAPGIHSFRYGNAVSACARPFPPENGTRSVCTGWRANGVYPDSGSATNLEFVLFGNVMLEWLWKTQHWIDVSATGSGTTDFIPQWVDDGTRLRIEIVPSVHLYDLSVEGDTDGAELDGTFLSFSADRPRRITIAVTERKLPLEVRSEHGEAFPGLGVSSHSWGETVSAGVVLGENDQSSTVRYECTGWRGTGSVPESGTGDSVSFELEEASTLEWLWTTNYHVSAKTEGPVIIGRLLWWQDANETVTVPYCPLADNYDLSLEGDCDGIEIDEESRTIQVPGGTPRTFRLVATPSSLASALDARGIEWSTGPESPWIPQIHETSDGTDAAESANGVDADSFLRGVLEGAGVLSWKWKLVKDAYAGIDFAVDGKDAIYFDAADGWKSASWTISGDGPHEILFTFWNEDGVEGDRAYLDQVSWSGTAPPAVTTSTPVPVPHDWLSSWPDLLASHGGDFEAAASSLAANGTNTVWECYVAGLDPTDPDDFFRVRIDMGDGTPVISWTPDLGGARSYLVEGRGGLDAGAGEWESPATDLHRFFRTRVSMPEEPFGSEAFPGSVVLTFDSNVGSVSPETKVFDQPGVVGPFPEAECETLDFAGWFTEEAGGFPFGTQTAVPFRDTVLHAHWNGNPILFNANGGTGEMESFACQNVGGSLSLPPCSFSRENFTFAGWATEPGGVAVFDDGATVSALLSGTVLYATWQEGTFEYEIAADGTAVVTGASETTSGFLSIPPRLDGHVVSGIGDEAFRDCSWLVSLSIPSTVGFLGISAFQGCSELTSVTIPDSVTNVGQSAFYGCSGLTMVSIPASVTGIEWNTFWGCWQVEETRIRLSDPSAWATNTINSSNLRGVPRLFVGEEEVTAITIPDGVTSIGDHAFSGYSGLTSISIPDSVTSIGSDAFRGCSGLFSITIPDGVTSIGDSAFYYCSGLTSVTIPDGVTSIGSSAFKGCSGLTSVTIPDGVTNIGYGVFNDCSGICVTADPKFGKAFRDATSFSFVLPEGVTSIGDEAFLGCSGLTSISIPNSVTSIENSAFSHCSGLTSITIPNGVTNIGSFAFSDCSGLTSVMIGNGVTRIEGYAFDGCSGLTSITIPDGVTSIGGYAFRDCSGLTEVTIPDSVTSIEYGAFSGCSAQLFDTDSVPGVQLVDGWAVGSTSYLSGHLNLTSVRGIANGAFYNCSGLTSIALPNSVRSIGGSAFQGCSGLTSITIPNSVTSIEKYAFYGCSNLSTLSLPSRFKGNSSILDGIPDGCTVIFRE